jgi:hypothetical protein
MAQYEYPLLSDAFEFFNGLTMLYAWFGMARPAILDPFTGFGTTGSVAQGGRCIVYTTRDLTPAEKTLLDSFMSSVGNMLYPTSTTGFTVYKVTDLFQQWAIMEGQTSKKIRWIFWDWPNPGNLEIWIEGTMNAATKKQLLNAYAASISEKV